MASADGVNKKRHVFEDRHDRSTGFKRICVEPFSSPMVLDLSSDVNNCWEVESSKMHPYYQFIGNASEPLNSLTAHSPTRLTAVPYLQDSTYPLSNHSQAFGSSQNTAGSAFPSHQLVVHVSKLLGEHSHILLC